MAVIFIGIDDTDNEASPGTGRLARLLSAEFESRGMRRLGVTRHQFLLDRAIPYTSHNSGACIAVARDGDIGDVIFALDFVVRHCAEGSDPGVCIARADEVTAAIIELAKAATEKVLDARGAFSLARSAGVRLYGLGGSCQGVIGALASVGARVEGNSGRFIDLPGLREMPRCVGAETLAKMNIVVEHKVGSRQPSAGDIYDTLGWARPRLINGRPVLFVEWSTQKNAWIPVDRKPGRTLR